MAPEDTAQPPPVRHLELKARLLLLLMLVLLSAAVAYLMYARGAFERTQQLVLIADDSEGVVVGMDMTFSGFPIGRVGRIELSDEGTARIIVDVPRRDAHWLRTSSVFTMENGLVGSTKIRAFSGILTDPPLPDGAERKVLRGDAAAEIPRMVASVRELVTNLSALTGSDAPLNATLRSLQTAAEKLNGPRGALGVLLGNEADAGRISVTLERTNALLTRLDGLVRNADGVVLKADGIALRTDGMVARADAQVFGAGGVVPETRATVVQLNGLLADARNSLKKVDAVLVEAQAIGANTREATNDLGLLRAEVDASLRKVEQLVNEVNRKWPFKRDTEIKLP
ncbi:MAG: mammalian cell entry protein [Rhodoferax sp.]|nr:mammalian cell entry protein [Rhodoferax sp.]